LIIAILTIATSLLTLKDSQADIWAKAVVKLYSNGQVAGTWEAIDTGPLKATASSLHLIEARQSVSVEHIALS